MIDHKERLTGLITDFVAGTTSFPEFEARYSQYYLEQLPEDASFTEQEWSLFSEVNERLDYTIAEPNAEEDRAGWQDVGEFRLWLSERANEVLGL